MALCGTVRVGVAWDHSFTERTDFDLSAVLYDQYGNNIDAVFYNNLNWNNSAIIHSGDNRSGEGAGDDETITLDIARLDCVVSVFFLVTAHSGGDTNTSVKGDFSVYNNSATVYNTKFESAKKNNAFLLSCLFRSQMGFQLFHFNKSGKGRTFSDAMYLIDEELNKFYTPQQLIERPAVINRVYSLHKGDVFVLNRNLTNVRLGLGWDPADGFGNIDVDASLGVFDANIQNITNIYFGHKSDFNGAIVHSGDNLTGQGEGEDEKISIDLNRLPPHVMYIVACVSIYSGATSFSTINRCFALLRDVSGKELCHYNLSQSYTSRAVIMCALHRRETGLWALECIGAPASNGTIQGNISDIVKALHVLNQKNTNSSLQSTLPSTMPLMPPPPPPMPQIDYAVQPPPPPPMPPMFPPPPVQIPYMFPPPPPPPPRVPIVNEYSVHPVQALPTVQQSQRRKRNDDDGCCGCL